MTPTNFQKFTQALLYVTRNNNNLRIRTNNHNAEVKYGNNTYLRFSNQNGKVWAWKGRRRRTSINRGSGRAYVSTGSMQHISRACVFITRE